MGLSCLDTPGHVDFTRGPIPDRISVAGGGVSSLTASSHIRVDGDLFPVRRVIEGMGGVLRDTHDA